MPALELFVGLKVPDNVAITAFHTLERMGYRELKKLERLEYCKFDFSGDVKNFQRKISQADILINANKHKFSFSLEKTNENNKINVLVQDLDDGNSLLAILKERLGFTNIKKMERGVLWAMYFRNIINAKEKAIEIAKGLLINENYQKFKLLE